MPSPVGVRTYPDFPSTHFLTLHLAFVAEDPEAVAAKLIAAGTAVADPMF